VFTLKGQEPVIKDGPPSDEEVIAAYREQGSLSKAAKMWTTAAALPPFTTSQLGAIPTVYNELRPDLLTVSDK
jgi:hypothetical protein